MGRRQKRCAWLACARVRAAYGQTAQACLSCELLLAVMHCVFVMCTMFMVPAWAARYNTRLLIRLTPKGIDFLFFLFMVPGW